MGADALAAQIVEAPSEFGQLMLLVECTLISSLRRHVDFDCLAATIQRQDETFLEDRITQKGKPKSVFAQIDSAPIELDTGLTGRFISTVSGRARLKPTASRL